MTIALKIGNEDSQVQGFIYFDAVTVYTKNLSGKVTSFPVDSGVNISDHFIPSNQKFSIEGVISESDIHGYSNSTRLNDDTAINARKFPTAANISGLDSIAPSFLPAAVSQFLDSKNAVVTSDEWDGANAPKVEALLTELMRGVYYNQANKKWRNKMITTTLYEMNFKVFVNAHTDLVITDISFREDADTGEGLTITMELEKIRMVGIEQVAIPKKAVAKKVAPTEKKGTPACPVGKVVDGVKEGAKDLAPKISPAAVTDKLKPALDQVSKFRP